MYSTAKETGSSLVLLWLLQLFALSLQLSVNAKAYAPKEPETQGWRGAVNEGLPKIYDLQKMWGYKVF